MMKLFRYIILLAFVAAFHISCDDEDDNGVLIEDGELYFMNLAVKNPTTLDTKFEVEVDAYNAFDKVEITYNGTTTKLGELALSGGKGVYSGSPESVGLEEVGDGQTLDFIYTNSNGQKYIQTIDVELLSPFGLTNVSGVIQDDTKHYFKFETSVSYQTLTNLVISSKIGANGTFEEIEEDYTVAKDSLLFEGKEFNINDTVYIRLDAVLGTKSHTETATFVVGMYSFANESEEISMDSSDSEFDLVKLENASEVDLSFVLGDDSNKIGFSGANETKFVVSNADLYNSGDIVQAKADYAAGSEISSVEDVDTGFVYIYKTVREDINDIDGDNNKTELVEYYGLIKIKNVTRTNSNDDDSFSFTYKY